MKYSFRRNALQFIPPLASFGALIMIWELLVRWLAVSPVILPAPTRVFQEFVKRSDEILFHSAITMFEAFAGLVTGVAFAMVCSFLILEFTTGGPFTPLSWPNRLCLPLCLRRSYWSGSATA